MQRNNSSSYCTMYAYVILPSYVTFTDIFGDVSHSLVCRAPRQLPSYALLSLWRIPRHRHRHRHRHPREDPREEIARVGRKDVGVSGESVSVSWNAAFTPLNRRADGQTSFRSIYRAVCRAYSLHGRRLCYQVTFELLVGLT